MLPGFLIAIGMLLNPPTLGTAPLGIQNRAFPCAKLIELHKSPWLSPSVALLPLSFGDSIACITRLTASKPGMPWKLRAYLSNESCRRFNRCDTRRELLPGYSSTRYRHTLEKNPKSIEPQILRRLYKIVQMLSPFGDLEIVAGLEDDLSPAARQNLITIIERGFYGKIIQNPLNPANRIGGYELEYHSLQPDKPRPRRACSVNNDGFRLIPSTTKPGSLDLPVSAFRAKFNHCGNGFIWHPAFNGIRYTKEGRFIKPHRRGFRLSNQDIRKLKATARQIID